LVQVRFSTSMLFGQKVRDPQSALGNGQIKSMAVARGEFLQPGPVVPYCVRVAALDGRIREQHVDVMVMRHRAPLDRLAGHF
jgi:hypothetical protein